MFVMLMYGFMIVGVCLAMFDVLFPYIPLVPVVNLGFRMIGVMLMFVGAVLYHGRMVNTTANTFSPLANPNEMIMLHLGKSGAKFIRAKKEEPNRLRAKTKRGWMNIKDVGDALNVAGHEVVITSQDDGHNYPLWLIDAISKWKQYYGVKDKEELLDLYKEIKNIEKEEDLENIEFLKPILADGEKAEYFDGMDIDDVRNMRILLYDGRTWDLPTFLAWDEGATPYDNESIIASNVGRIRAEDQAMKFGGATDWAKIVIPAMIILILGAIAYQIFMGG